MPNLFCTAKTEIWGILTYPLRVIVVLHRLYVWLQFIYLIANIHPLIFHDLLREKQTTVSYTRQAKMYIPLGLIPVRNGFRDYRVLFGEINLAN